VNANLYAGQEYILKFFPVEMLEPTVAGGHRGIDEELKALLTHDTPDLRLIRNQLNGCLELAYRKGIVDAELTSRMQSGDYGSFESAFAELKVARFIESLGNAVDLYPPGREGRLADIRATGQQSSCLIEVETLFPSKDERNENSVSDKLWYYANRTSLPFLINFSDFTPDKDFQGRRFEQWLSKNLSKMIEEEVKSRQLHYANKHGFSVNIQATYIGGQSAVRKAGLMVTSTMHDGETIHPSDRLLEKLKAAQKQLPKRGEPCMVVIDDQLQFGLTTEELEAVLYGNGKVAGPQRARARNREGEWRRNGFFSPKRNNRISGIGMYYTNTKMHIIEEELEVYHNPWADSSIDTAMFGSKIVKHYSLGSNGHAVVEL
jgi:hypothetical protein